MLTGNLRPTTLGGVKSLAAQIRKEQSIKHSIALDLAAKAANCTNFRNARHTLPIRSNGRLGSDLGELVAKINAMPAPMLEKNWMGETSSSWDTFASPMAKTAQDIRRARCRGTIYPAASATTVPYSYNLGSRRRRPAGKLGIDGHIEAGRIIKAVILSNNRPYGVYNRLNSLRSTLEDWMGLEIGHDQLDGPEFFDVYYHEDNGDNPYSEMATTHDGMVSMLVELKKKLQAAYPNCAQLRQQLHRINVSVSLLGKWHATHN